MSQIGFFLCVCVCVCVYVCVLFSEVNSYILLYMGPHLQALICFLEDPNLILYFTVKMIFFENLLYWLNKWMNFTNNEKL